MGYLIEKYYPLIVSLLASVIFYWNKVNIIELEKLEFVLGSVVSIVSIVIAFLGTMMTILITLSNENVMVRIRQHNGHTRLVSYLKASIISGVLVAIFSLYLYVHSSQESIVNVVLTSLYISLCAFFALSGFRIFAVVFLIFEDVMGDKTTLPEKEKKVVIPEYNKDL